MGVFCRFIKNEVYLRMDSWIRIVSKGLDPYVVGLSSIQIAIGTLMNCLENMPSRQKRSVQCEQSMNLVRWQTKQKPESVTRRTLSRSEPRRRTTTGS